MLDETGACELKFIQRAADVDDSTDQQRANNFARGLALAIKERHLSQDPEQHVPILLILDRGATWVRYIKALDRALRNIPGLQTRGLIR